MDDNNLNNFENGGNNIPEQPVVNNEPPVIEVQPVDANTEPPVIEVQPTSTIVENSSPIDEILNETNASNQGNVNDNQGCYTYVPPKEEPVFTVQNTAKPAPNKSNKKGLKIFCLILAFAVVAISCFSIGHFTTGTKSSNITVNNNKGNNNTTSNTTSSSTGQSSDFNISTNSGRVGTNKTYAEVAESASKFVVSISIYAKDGSAAGAASGIIMSSDGYVLTNDHIYEEISAPNLLVTLADGTEYKADFVAGDTRSDLSIIKLRDASGLPTATFGSSSALEVGDEVMAIGSSDGFTGTVTTGIVSCKDRRLAYTSENYKIKLIQMTAIINPGSSGGALVNMNGEVVGVTSSKIVSSSVEGICFAIPSDYAVDIVKNLQENGTVKGRAKLGITYTSIGTAASEINNLPKGVYINSISTDSCFAGQNVATGDVIVSVNGKAINDSDELLDEIESVTAGTSMSFEIYKADTKQNITVVVALPEYEGKTSYTEKIDNDTETTSNVYQIPNNNKNNNSNSSNSNNNNSSNSNNQDFLEPNNDGNNSNNNYSQDFEEFFEKYFDFGF